MGNAAFTFRARPFNARIRATDVPAYSLLEAVASMQLFIVHYFGSGFALCSSACPATATAGSALWIVYRLDEHGLKADASITKALQGLSSKLKSQTVPHPPLSGNVYVLSDTLSMKRLTEKWCVDAVEDLVTYSFFSRRLTHERLALLLRIMGGSVLDEDTIRSDLFRRTVQVVACLSGTKPSSERAMKLCKKNKTDYRVVLLNEVMKDVFLKTPPDAALPFLHLLAAFHGRKFTSS